MVTRTDFKRPRVRLDTQDLFVEHLSTFFVRFSDPRESRRTRLRIMVALANEQNIRIVLKELVVESLLSSSSSAARDRDLKKTQTRSFFSVMFRQPATQKKTYIKDVDDEFSSMAVSAIGTCAERVPAVSRECLKTLIKLLASKHGK